MLAAVAITFGSSSVSIVEIGRQGIRVSVLCHPVFALNEVLVQSLAPYAKVNFLARAAYQDVPNIQTGTCRLSVITVEETPLSSFLRVDGQRARSATMIANLSAVVAGKSMIFVVSAKPSSAQDVLHMVTMPRDVSPITLAAVSFLPRRTALVVDHMWMPLQFLP